MNGLVEVLIQATLQQLISDQSTIPYPNSFRDFEMLACELKRLLERVEDAGLRSQSSPYAFSHVPDSNWQNVAWPNLPQDHG